MNLEPFDLGYQEMLTHLQANRYDPEQPPVCKFTDAASIEEYQCGAKAAESDYKAAMQIASAESTVSKYLSMGILIFTSVLVLLLTGTLYLIAEFIIESDAHLVMKLIMTTIIVAVVYRLFRLTFSFLTIKDF